MSTSLQLILRSGLAAGALLAASGLAGAQTLLPELIVISPSLEPIAANKTGSSVTAMSGDEARATGFMQLADVIRTFPGVAVNQSGSRGSLTQFRVRGAEANQLLVMIDGVPANAVGDGEYNFADIPLDDIQRIELLRGPQSGLYGANAMAGVLTIETKSGRGLAKPEFNARVEGGSQRSADGSATFRGALGPFYYSTTGTYATTNGFNIARDGNETDGAKRAAVTAKAGVDVTPYFNVEGFVRHLYRNGVERSAGPVLPQQRTGCRRARLQHQDRRNAGARRGHAEAVRRPLDPVGEMDRIAHGRHGVREFHAGLGLARHRADTDLQEQRPARQQLRGRRDAPHHRPAREPEATLLTFDSFFLFGPDLDAARNGYSRTTNSIGGEYVLDLSRTGTTISIAQRQDFNDPFQDEYTWRYSSRRNSDDRRAAAHQRRARRHQPELHRAVRIHRQHIPAQSQSRSGDVDRLGRGLGADLLERPRCRRRDVFQFAAGERDRL